MTAHESDFYADTLRSARKALRDVAALRIDAEKVRMILERFGGLGLSATVDTYPGGGLNLFVRNASDEAFKGLFRYIRQQGFPRNRERVKSDDGGCWYYYFGGLTVLHFIESGVNGCRKVKTGTRTVVEDVYEIVCPGDERYEELVGPMDDNAQPTPVEVPSELPF